MNKSYFPGRLKAVLRGRVSTLIAALAIAALPLTASAYPTECVRTPARFYVGNGILYVLYAEGGIGTMSQTSIDFKPVFAVMLMAITNKHSVVVRYAPEGVACDSQQTIDGVWLSQQ